MIQFIPVDYRFRVLVVRDPGYIFCILRRTTKDDRRDIPLDLAGELSVDS